MKDFIINPFALIHPGERPSKKAWTDFALMFLLAVGTGLLLTGIIFFFAYNWVDLHHLIKLSIIGATIAALAIGACFCQKNRLAQQMLLSGASVMVGVLLAVYGQAYHLESDSGFLAWALFILLWCLVADFDALWMVFAIVLLVGISNFSKDRNNELAAAYITSMGLIVVATLIPHYLKSVRKRSMWLIFILFAFAAILALIQMIQYFDEWINAAYFFSFVASAGLYGLWKRRLSVMSLGFLMVLIEINIFSFESLMVLGTLTVLASLAAYIWFIKWLKKAWNTPNVTLTENGNTE